MAALPASALVVSSALQLLPEAIESGKARCSSIAMSMISQCGLLGCTYMSRRKRHALTEGMLGKIYPLWLMRYPTRYVSQLIVRGESNDTIDDQFPRS